MLTYLLVQATAGALMVGLFRYQRLTVRRWNRRGRIRLDEGFGREAD
jgi:hypothetical protein